MEQKIPKINWSSGEAYEAYVGRWSRLVATEFLQWLAQPPGKNWLDVGCGTGALSQTILNHYPPAHLTGIDRSENFIAGLQQKIQGEQVTFEVGDAQELPLETASVDITVSGLVLNFVPDMNRAVLEMRRVTRPGGTIALYLWDYAEGMQLMRYFWDAAVTLNPAALTLDEWPRFPICQPEPLKQLFIAAGLTQPQVRPIDVPTHFQDFAAYWTPFLQGQGPAPTYCMSLDEPQRQQLRETLRASLPTKPDGTIHLTARAWAIRTTN
jgi:SAM-dependent methyltransferase